MAPDGRSSSSIRRTLRFLRWPGIALVILVLFFLLALGPVARSTLEEALSETHLPSVSVRKVTPRIMAGSVEVQRLAIGNPEGFSRREAIVFSRVEFATALHEFLDEKVLLRGLVIHEPRVFLEVRPEGINLVALTEALRAQTAAQTATNPGGSENTRTDNVAAGKRFKVSDGAFRGLRIRYIRSKEEALVFDIQRSPFLVTERWYTLDEILERILTQIIEALLRDEERERLPQDVLRDLEWSLQKPESR